jgi:hypothetical protein
MAMKEEVAIDFATELSIFESWNQMAEEEAVVVPLPSEMPPKFVMPPDLAYVVVASVDMSMRPRGVNPGDVVACEPAPLGLSNQPMECTPPLMARKKTGRGAAGASTAFTVKPLESFEVKLIAASGVGPVTFVAMIDDVACICQRLRLLAVVLS